MEISFQASSDKLSIQVYYESLCPDSKNFITTQLYPTYQKLGKYLKVDFKPFGNADVSVVNSKILQNTILYFTNSSNPIRTEAGILTVNMEMMSVLETCTRHVYLMDSKVIIRCKLKLSIASWLMIILPMLLKK